MPDGAMMDNHDHDHPELRALTPHQRALVLAHRETFRAIAADHREGGRAHLPHEVLAGEALDRASVADNDNDNGGPSGGVFDIFNGRP